MNPPWDREHLLIGGEAGWEACTVGAQRAVAFRCAGFQPATDAARDGCATFGPTFGISAKREMRLSGSERCPHLKEAHLPIVGDVWRALCRPAEWHGHLARGRAPRHMGETPMPLAPPSIVRCAHLKGFLGFLFAAAEVGRLNKEEWNGFMQRGAIAWGRRHR